MQLARCRADFADVARAQAPLPAAIMRGNLAAGSTFAERNSTFEPREG